jgi:hypothetical protein
MPKDIILLEAGSLAICLAVILRARPEDLPDIVKSILKAIRRK